MSVRIGVTHAAEDGAVEAERGVASHLVVAPGDVITSDPGFLRGHGTYVDDSRLIASVPGIVERVNKLVSVRPMRARYTGNVGDVVVGRVVEVGAKRWKVDVGARQHAVLMLSAVILPGGVQRRRTSADQLAMRDFFSERDLVSAEVQAFYGDGTMTLHTRSLKYGKLENGQFLVVPAALIKRLKQHSVSLPCGVDAILGNNGYIWLTETPSEDVRTAPGERPLAEEAERRRRVQAEHVIAREARMRMARVANAIRCLSAAYVAISPDTIMDVYRESERHGVPVKDMLVPGVFEGLVAVAKDTVQMQDA